MPITYDFPFNRATELNSRPLKQTRYNFTIDNTVDDPWDSRFTPTNPLNPPYIPNHPIDIRLMSPKVVSTATWELAAPSLVHSNSAPDTLPTSLAPIPNPMASVSSVLNIDVAADIDPISTNETSGIDSGDGGMQMFPTGIASNLSLSNPATGAANSLDITNLVSVYSNQIRNLGNSAGLTLVMMVMGSNQAGVGPMAPGNTVNESNYITGPASFGANPFNQEFYKTSSYFAFNSADSAIPATRSMNVGTATSPQGTCQTRKDFPYTKLSLSMVQAATSPIQVIRYSNITLSRYTISIHPDSIASVSAFFNAAYTGSYITTNRYGTEDMLADKILVTGTAPTQIACQPVPENDNKVFLHSISNSGFTLSATNGGAGATAALFSDSVQSLPVDTFTFNIVRFGQGTLGGESVSYRAQNNSQLVIRSHPGVTSGSKNMLVIDYSVVNPRRLFNSGTSTNSVGIAVGSYVRLSGNDATSRLNDGVYQVTQVHDSISGDSITRNESGGVYNGNGQRFQAIEVVPDFKTYGTFNGTIQNITDILPVLHIKYREP